MRSLLFIIVVFLSGCTTETVPPEQQVKLKVNVTKTVAFEGDERLWTDITHFEYNGHQWIKFTYYRHGAAVHDPDCPCQRRQR